MKAVHIAVLIVGVILTFATESESATANIIGLLLVVYECNKLDLFSYGRSDKYSNVPNEQRRG